MPLGAIRPPIACDRVSGKHDAERSQPAALVRLSRYLITRPTTYPTTIAASTGRGLLPHGRLQLRCHGLLCMQSADPDRRPSEAGSRQHLGLGLLTGPYRPMPSR